MVYDAVENSMHSLPGQYYLGNITVYCLIRFVCGQIRLNGCVRVQELFNATPCSNITHYIKQGVVKSTPERNEPTQL